MQSKQILKIKNTFYIVLFIFFGLFMAQITHAIEAPPLAENPELESKVMQVAAELRCLVCQNESIADSHADLALDLRRQIKEQLQSGKSQKQIIDYMVERYGDFVLYNPPVKSNTLVLWFGPFILMIGSLFALFRFARKKTSSKLIHSNSTAEIEKARELLSSSRKNLE